MPIYIDPSEARKGSRMPPAIIKIAEPISALEAVTGADMLISPLRRPKLEWITDALPHQLILRKHCQAGRLVQRKTGRDLANSVPRLSQIRDKMLRWTDSPELLFVGILKCDSNGMAIIDGQNSHFSYAAIQGALASWQRPKDGSRGGCVTFLSRDGLIAPWIDNQMTRLRLLREHPERATKQHVLTPLAGLDTARVSTVRTLMTCGEIGVDKATLIADHCGSLAWSLVYLSEGEKQSLKGIGPKTFLAARRWLFGDQTDLELKVYSRVQDGVNHR